ncbi:Uncaracterized surface protein containing fasciclin (FAS1) repeats [Fodinibius salinus]|uniref:Uncaracterized surface protein containing fasciclin (FAS1) repeats n=1 Tax=Fodinibius salinus TaxID=860790 RepID=A0A5D3YLP4_9BACT|nr:fasciclin domain-containing protein [Fodinibius salinus]TYP93836.1 Uncaracterized surface protein containing fasciclin (FAS1) repeats [Fodinibius salinus]
MSIVQKIASTALVMIISTALISCGNTKEKPNNTTTQNETTSASTTGQAGVKDDASKAHILQIAKESPDHTILAKAIEAAGIQNVLANPGPLTVFAPTDDAFKALPEGTLDDLMKPENKSKLAKILTSHASPASLDQDQLAKGTNVYLATGQYVKSEKKDGDIYVNGAKILGSVDASNGEVHVVDKVFLVAAN